MYINMMHSAQCVIMSAAVVLALFLPSRFVLAERNYAQRCYGEDGGIEIVHSCAALQAASRRASLDTIIDVQNGNSTYHLTLAKSGAPGRSIVMHATPPLAATFSHSTLPITGHDPIVQGFLFDRSGIDIREDRHRTTPVQFQKGGGKAGAAVTSKVRGHHRDAHTEVVDAGTARRLSPPRNLGIYDKPSPPLDAEPHRCTSPLNFASMVDGPLEANCGWRTVDRLHWVDGKQVHNNEGAPATAEVLSKVGSDIVLRTDGKRIDKWGWVGFPKQRTRFTAEWQVTIANNADGTPPNFSINFDDSSNYALRGNNTPLFGELSAMPCYLRGSKRRVVAYYGDGDGFNRFDSQTALTYDGNATYRCRAVIDPVAGTYSSTLSINGGAERTVAKDYPFRRSAAKINAVSFWGASLDETTAVSHSAVITIDYITISR